MDGLRQDLLAQACDAGDLPALSELRARCHRMPWCRVSCPSATSSLATLWTALPPERHGVRMDRLFRLEDHHETLAERLAQDGVRTAAYLSNGDLTVRSGILQGFGEVDPPLSEQLVMALEGQDADFGQLRRPLEDTVAQADAWLARARTPFFLWVQLEVTGHDDSGRPAADVYRERLSALDAAVGRLCRNLERADRHRRTLVALVGTVGELHGEHGRHDVSRSLDDEALHVPFWYTDHGEPDPAISNTEVPEQGAGMAGPMHSMASAAASLGARIGQEVVGSTESRQWFEALAAALEGGRPPVRGTRIGPAVVWFDGRLWERGGRGGSPVEVTDPEKQDHYLQVLFEEFATVSAPRIVTSEELEERLTHLTTGPAPAHADDSWREHAGSVERLLIGKHGFDGPGPEVLAEWRQRLPEDARILEMWLQSRIGRIDREEPSADLSDSISTAVSRLPHSAYLSALASHPRYHRVPADQRAHHGWQSLAVAPWYFPAARGIASALGLDAAGVSNVLDRFAAEAPLGPEARAELTRRRALTEGSGRRQPPLVPRQEPEHPDG